MLQWQHYSTNFQLTS